MRSLRLWTLLGVVAASIAVAACSVPVDLSWGSATGTPTPSGTQSQTPTPTPDQSPLLVDAQTVVNSCYPIVGLPAAGSQIQLSTDPPDILEDSLVFLVKVVDRPATQLAGSANWPDPIGADRTDAGLFAVIRVSAKGGDILTLVQEPDARFATGSQACTFPYYPTVTIGSSPGAAIVPPYIWDGLSGGIVAFKTDSLEVNGEINASFHGFQGGDPNVVINSSMPTIESNVPCDNGGALAVGAHKAEGIAGIFDDPSVNDCGRGLFATGGGGGNFERGGGGGGGNGGAGGGAISSVPPTPTNAEGGRRADLQTRLLMGGGGGGGQYQLSGGGTGGRGGGIVYLEVGALSGIGAILSDGEDGMSVQEDGAGGGGAGGTLHIAITTPSSSGVLLRARGGGAGSVLNGDGCMTNTPYGVGGPGGGGRVHLTTGTGITPDVAPGLLGDFDGNCGMPLNMDDIGTPGGAGVVQALP